MDGRSAAVVEGEDPSFGVLVKGDDDADQAHPFDGVVEEEIRFLSWAVWLVILSSRGM